MRNGKSTTAFVDTVESKIQAITPASLAFVLTLTGGLADRYRRLRKERDNGAVSIEAAIIMAVLIAAAVAIAAVVIKLWSHYQDQLDKSDNNYKGPNQDDTPRG
jgi:UDP-N-acetylmuramyl pentapeptide phosphotransferase/UDP-N-acetylglucosamine-1-phosphate transferase